MYKKKQSSHREGKLLRDWSILCSWSPRRLPSGSWLTDDPLTRLTHGSARSPSMLEDLVIQWRERAGVILLGRSKVEGSSSILSKFPQLRSHVCYQCYHRRCQCWQINLCDWSQHFYMHYSGNVCTTDAERIKQSSASSPGAAPSPRSSSPLLISLLLSISSSGFEDLPLWLVFKFFSCFCEVVNSMTCPIMNLWIS